jgi:hypothetical protein
MSDRIEIFGNELVMRGEPKTPGGLSPILTRPIGKIVGDENEGSSGVLPPNVVFSQQAGNNTWMTYHIPPGVRPLLGASEIRHQIHRVAVPNIYLTICCAQQMQLKGKIWSFAGAYVHFADKEIVTIDDEFLVDAPLPDTAHGGAICLGDFPSSGISARAVVAEAVKAFWGNAFHFRMTEVVRNWINESRDEVLQRKWADPDVPTITLRTILDRQKVLSYPQPKSLRTVLKHLIHDGYQSDIRNSITSQGIADTVHRLAAEINRAKRR